jgi:hypothetical protein
LPELVEEFERLGFAQLMAFAADPTVFCYAEITDEQAFDGLWASKIFHLETAANA